MKVLDAEKLGRLIAENPVAWKKLKQTAMSERVVLDNRKECREVVSLFKNLMEFHTMLDSEQFSRMAMLAQKAAMELAEPEPKTRRVLPHIGCVEEEGGRCVICQWVANHALSDEEYSLLKLMANG